eukprot:SAG31_NODE_4986_length_2819_cov_2.012868_4_plen_82_part_00
MVARNLRLGAAIRHGNMLMEHANILLREASDHAVLWEIRSAGTLEAHNLHDRADVESIRNGRTGSPDAQPGLSAACLRTQA